MKKLVMALLPLLITHSAYAAVVNVVKRPIAMGGGASYLVFNYNENGRAWIEEKDTNGFSEGNGNEFLHYHLSGLRFNPATREIMFGKIACANVVSMGLGYGVYNTGRCSLSSIKSSRSHETDDGTETTDFETIVMDVH
jgi:hypothetical protein